MKNFRTLTISILMVVAFCLPVAAQYNDTWLLKKIEVTNRLNQFSQVTREQYNANGGSIDLTVDGRWEGSCPGGREILRFNWTFPQDISRITDNASVNFEAGIAGLNKPCAGGIAEYSGIYVSGSAGVTGALSDQMMQSVDVDRVGTVKDGQTRAAGNITPRTGSGSVAVNHSQAYNPKRPMAYIAIWIHPRSGGDLIYVYEYARGGGVAVGGNDTTPYLPRAVNECEAYQSTICGSWTLSGNQFIARWNNGATATLTIERFDADGIVLVRRDTNSDFTARYEGRPSGRKVEGGYVTWTSQGRSWSGRWSASW